MNKTSALDKVTKWLMRAKHLGYSKRGISKTKAGKGLMNLIGKKK